MKQTNYFALFRTLKFKKFRNFLFVFPPLSPKKSFSSPLLNPKISSWSLKHTRNRHKKNEFDSLEKKIVEWLSSIEMPIKH